MKIAMACSEANPFVKTGGLADVTYSLSKELVKLGEEVVIVLPLYTSPSSHPPQAPSRPRYPPRTPPPGGAL